MAENESKSQLAGVLAPALLVAAMSFLGYITYEPSLKTARQLSGGEDSVPEPPTVSGIAALHARLWDDPLEVADRDSQNSKKLKAKSRRTAEEGSEDGDSPIQRVMHDLFHKFLDPESASTARPSGPAAARHVLLMPVFVPGEPWGDDSEGRKRTTYAVLAALNVAHYELSDPDRISYAEIPISVFDASTNREIPVDLTVPLELCVPQDHFQIPAANVSEPRYSAVVVCLINESQMGSRPLAALRQVLMGIFGSEHVKRWKDRIDLCVVGPRTSDTLIQMAREDVLVKPGNEESAAGAGPLNQDQFVKDFRDARLLSAASTACQEDFSDGQEAFMNGGKSRSGLTIVRTIGTDNELAAAIHHEFALRGAWPLKRGDGKYVVLVTESDTHYGRSIGWAFRRDLHDILRDNPEHHERQLQVFNYLQGIDGKLRDSKNDESDTSAAKAEPAKPEAAAAAVADNFAASGRSQFDYLRRLEDHLLDFHLEKRKQGQAGITAIGVVGSDVYDKLLVLRALRKKFPRAWFFTTDVDAELMRTNEYPTTRNLLIASHFGLELNRHLQRQTPPFRDSYQTATFLACLYGLREERVHSVINLANENNFWSTQGHAVNRSLEPLVFELGRSGPFQLTTTRNRATLSADIHPHSPREERWFGLREAFAFAAIVFGVLALLAIHSSRARDILGHGSPLIFCAWTGGVIAALCLTAVLIQWSNQQPDGEPFTVFEGISLWLPILIRLGAAAAGFLLLLSAVRHVKLEPTIAEIVGSLLDDEGEKVRTRPIVQTSLAQDLTGSYEKCVGWGRDVWRCLARKRSRQIALSVWPRGLGSTKTATQTISRYGGQGNIARRTIRAGVIGIAIFSCSFALYSLADYPLQPYRGVVSEYLSKFAMAAATFFLFALTSFVLDALRLSRKLIRQLGRVAPDWPVKKRANDPRRHVLTIRFIARRTHSVGKLTWYPLTVLLLMILARSKSFDLIDFSWPLLVLWISIGALVTLTTWEFRKAANESRETILDRLRDEMYGLHDQAVPGVSKERYRQAIEEIEGESAGAFRPFTQDPLFASLLLFFGRSGGILIFDQLVPYL